MKEGHEARGNPPSPDAPTIALQGATGQVPNRRAFLIAGATFAVGAWLGIEGGYAVAVARAGAKCAAPELPPTDDADLAEMRRLAVAAPIAELVEKRLVFVSCVAGEYNEDAIVWRGVARLCEVTLADHGLTDRRLFGRFLAQMIENGPRELVAPLRDLAPQLRGIK